MSRGTAYYDLPNGERIELPTTMPDVEEVPGPLCDGKFELPEAVKEMFKWMDETFGTWESDFSDFKIWTKLRKNFNPPERWKAVQDKRRNPIPLGRNTYLYKARKIHSLARSTHTHVALQKGTVQAHIQDNRCPVRALQWLQCGVRTLREKQCC